MTARVRIEEIDGRPAAVLATDRVEAAFLPGLGMLGVSLRLDGHPFLSLGGGTTAFAHGHTTGLPLLHPWANRLGAEAYEVAGRSVDLTGIGWLHRDGHGLPIHGTMVGARVWDIVELRATGKRARLTARFDYGAHPQLLEAFPFPHVVEVEVTLRGTALRVQTTIRSTGDRRVPVSFGWHPYLRLPTGTREEWRLQLPDREHLALDGDGLPTGDSTFEAAEADVIGDRTFDDLYQLAGKGPWSLGLESDDHRLQLELDEGYPFAQVWVPKGEPHVALEPMTAPTDALVTGDVRKVKPGRERSATFTLHLSSSAPPAG